MLLSIIGQFHEKFRKFRNIQFCLLTENFNTDMHYLLVYCQGKHEVLVYGLNSNYISNLEFTSQNIKASSSVLDVVSQNEKLLYLTSLSISFPIHFVMDSNEMVWVIGLQEYINIILPLKEAIRANIHNRKRKFSEKDIDDISKTSSCIAPNLKYSASVYINEKSFQLSNNTICFVDIFLNNSLLFICTDILRKCWRIQALVPDKEVILLSRVPFPNGRLKYLDEQNSSSSDYNDFSKMHFPVLKCVHAEGMDTISNDCTLTVSSFIAFFGQESLVLSQSVILFGSSNGQVLWKPFLLQYLNELDPVFKFRILCDIEQPIKDIHLCSSHNDNKYNSVLILGAFGKILFLCSEKCKIHQSNKKQAFQIVLSCIPTPLWSYIFLGSNLYHVSRYGELWISKFEKVKNGCICKLGFHQSCSTKLCGIMLLKSFIKLKDVIVLCTFSGQIYIAAHLLSKKLFEENFNYLEQVPCLLDAGHKISEQLCDLKIVEVKQKKLFSLLTFLAALKKQDDWSKNITIREIRKNKLMISVSLISFNEAHVESNLCYLSASLFMTFKKEMCVQKNWPYIHGCNYVFWEVDLSMWPCSDYLTSPLTLVIGINVHIPKKWKILDHFKLVNGIPHYFKLSSVFIHELLFLKGKSDVFPSSPLGFASSSSDTVVSNLQKLYKMRPTAQNSKTRCKAEAPVMSMCIQLFICSVQNLLKLSGFHSQCKIFLTALNQAINVSEEHEFICCGNTFNMSFIPTEQFLRCRIKTGDFSLLFRLKLSLLHLFMINENKNSRCLQLTLSKVFSKKLEELSAKVDELIIEDELLNINTDLLNIYRCIRENISPKFCL